MTNGHSDQILIATHISLTDKNFISIFTFGYRYILQGQSLEISEP